VAFRASALEEFGFLARRDADVFLPRAPLTPELSSTSFDVFVGFFRVSGESV
jgi:hypothetical protein